MRKLRLVLIFVTALMMLITTTSCDKKTTEPTITPGKMILVPAALYMGNTRGVVDNFGNEYDDELPTHSVTLRPFTSANIW